MAEGQLAIVLDVDGTLVDSNYEHIRAWYEAFCEAGIGMPQARIHQAIGMGGDQLIPHLLGWGANDPCSKALSERHGAIFKDRYLAQVRPLPAATDFVRRLADAGCRVALASSAQAHELDHYIELLDIQSSLAATVSKADVGKTKPAPDVFAVACEKLGVSPDQAIAMGDTVWDGESARRVGMRFVAVCTGWVAACALQQAGASATYEDLPALLADWDRSPFGG